MSNNRRVYRLADSTKRDNTDLREYADLITNAINNAVPGKHPKIFEHHFTTDWLTHSEAVTMGRALSKINELICFGKKVEQFRLFEGKPLSEKQKQRKNHKPVRGGRMA